MRVCKHGLWRQDVLLFARYSCKHKFEKGSELKNSSSLLYLPISSSAETWKIFRNRLCQFVFAWADILSEKNPYFGKHLFCKTRTERTSFEYKISRLVRVSLLISTLNKRLLLFSSWKLFYKSNKKLFSCVCISWYKHSRGWETSQQLYKLSTSSRVCITVSNSPNPSCLYQAMQTRKTFTIV